MLSRRELIKLMMNTGLGATMLPYTLSSQPEASIYLMSYFRTHAEALHLAYSLDGYH